MKYNTIQQDVQNINLLHLAPKIQSYEYRGFFSDVAGREHYKLLAYFSTQYNNTILYDIGTNRGCSALALSYNSTNTIKTFDIVNIMGLTNPPENIEWYIGDFLKEPIEEILKSPFIMLDIDHTGKTEKEILDFLIENKWHGLLLLDDIYLNAEMKQFWSDITLPKYDLSHMGHFSGTGLVEL
jgi:hypothetical protein